VTHADRPADATLNHSEEVASAGSCSLRIYADLYRAEHSAGFTGRGA